MRNGNAARRAARSRGVTYLGVLLLVAVLGLGLAATGEVWQTAAQRERENQLIFVGNQYRKAIERYYRSTQGDGRFPRELGNLLKDPRRPDTRRYLRTLYADPISGKADWGLVRAPDGGIAGVYSLSEDAPIKTTGFRPENAALAGRTKYVDWKFEYVPGVGASTPTRLP